MLQQHFSPSTSSVTQLAVFIAIRAVDCVSSEGVPTNAINLWPEDGWHGALQAIPIYICAFTCHFNVLPVHGELAKPTRERLHRMVRGGGMSRWLVLFFVLTGIRAERVFRRRVGESECPQTAEHVVQPGSTVVVVDTSSALSILCTRAACCLNLPVCNTLACVAPRFGRCIGRSALWRCSTGW